MSSELKNAQACGPAESGYLTGNAWRALARDLFSGAALARATAPITVAKAAVPSFSPLLGGALDSYFGWRAEVILVGGSAAVAAIAYDVFVWRVSRSCWCSLFRPTVLPFLTAMCVFLLGIGMLHPLGSAQAL